MLRLFFVSAALLGATVAVGCAVPDVGSSNSEVNSGKNTPKRDPSKQGDDDDDDDKSGVDAKGEDDTTAACSDECTEGRKRCSVTSSSAVEVCVKASDGCRRWTQGTDCDVNFQCNRAANDGTCIQGCASDPGCSAASVGTARCSSNGTAEQTCTAVGGCFIFRTTRTGVPQQCTGSGNFCSTGQRVLCVAKTAGACVSHTLQANPCSSGFVCSAGACIASTPSCTNQCVLHARRCSTASNAKQDCVMASNGCTVWTSTSCASSHVCFDGVCGPP